MRATTGEMAFGSDPSPHRKNGYNHFLCWVKWLTIWYKVL